MRSLTGRIAPYFLRRLRRRILDSCRGLCSLLLDPYVDQKLSLSALDVAIDTVVGNGIVGDYYEFGVYNGSSFVYAYKRFKLLAKQHQPDMLHTMHFVALDSFEGLPETVDAYSPQHYFRGNYAGTLEVFNAKLKKAKIPFDRVVILKGFYGELLEPELVSKYSLRKVSVAYLDCDLYESTKQALGFLTDLVQDGSLLVFDDWFRHRSSPHHGVQRACHEWLEEHPGISLHLVHMFRRVAFSVSLNSHESAAH